MPILNDFAKFSLAKEFKGKLRLGGPEAERQSENNKFLFEWISLNELNKFLIYPKGLVEKILKHFSE